MKAKICGIKDSNTLKYIINHKYCPEFIGFICNYKKSKRYLNYYDLKKLINIEKKKTNFVAVLVKPNKTILEKIKNLNFDYYQLYDVSPQLTETIKDEYNKKIITALTIENKNDVERYKEYAAISDIILFDSKGYEKSLSFNHNLLINIPNNIKKMIAGNIKIEDISNFKNSPFIIDVSSAVENEKGIKDVNKIDKFLNSVHINSHI